MTGNTAWIGGRGPLKQRAQRRHARTGRRGIDYKLMRRVLAVVLPLAVVLALALWRGRGPEPKPETAPALEFSAQRAMGELQDLLVDGVPHPMATVANQRVQARLVARFRALGYETEVQRRFACNASAACGMVENVIARRPGASRREAVVLTAHYDSVGAGIGASDDGAGVATLLEVARVLQGKRFRNPVAFLVTEGEEIGLVGAEAFVADAALAAEMSTVVSVEMRGTYGPSNMFETSNGNRWLIRHLSQSLDRPQATSLYFAVYKLLPNDTDVTVFKRAGKAAVNFAATRGVNWYHTRLDDLAHMNARTLQHHGDNALAITRTLAEADLGARSTSDATYFDILGFYLVWWPQEWTVWIAVASLLLLLFAARRTPPREMTFGVLTAFTAILASAGIGIGIGMLTRLRTADVNFVARPAWSVTAMWIAGIAAALFAATVFRKKSQPLAMLYGVGMVWHAIGIAVAFALPGAAFVFIVPAVLITACALARAEATVTGVVAATGGAVLIFPMALILYDALGGSLMAGTAILIGLLMTLAAPLITGWRVTLAALFAAIVCGVFAMMQPAYDAEHPQPLSITYLDDAAAPAPMWVVPKATASLSKVARFQPSDPALTPWYGGWSNQSAPAPKLNLQRVTLTGSRSGGKLTVRLQSSRGANRLTLLLRGDVKILSVNGVPPAPRPARFRERTLNGWHFATANGVDEMVVECQATGPVEAVASEMTFGLTPLAAPLQQARDATPAIPIQDGDVTVTRTRATF